MFSIFETVLPVFLMIGLGVFLRRNGSIEPASVSTLSWIVFYIASPALLFRSAALVPVEQSFDPVIVGTVIATTLVATIIPYFLGRMAGPDRQGVIAQGVFRSNMVFVGLPILINAFGSDPETLSPVTTAIGLTVPLYNLLAVLVLVLPHRNRPDRSHSLAKTAGKILLNPLILSSVGGLLYSASGLPLPTLVDRTLEMPAKTASPLALLVVGASLDFRSAASSISLNAIVSAGKLIVYPSIYLGILIFLESWGWIDLKKTHLEMVILMASPTAVAAHIMARELGGDERFSSAIVVASTCLSIFTISGWLLVLHHFYPW